MKRKTVVVVGLIAALAAGGGYALWQQRQAGEMPEGFVSTNGRIEADQVNISTKYAGRIASIAADEGDMVEAGQVLARMDDAELAAQVRAAEAQVRRAQTAKREAEASVARVMSDQRLARSELDRIERLRKLGHATAEQLDTRRAAVSSASAGIEAARAGVQAAEASIDAAQEELVRLRATLDNAVLVAPISGRVQYRLAEPGEILPAGGAVLTLLNTTNVYMNVFLPAAEAGRLALGDDARLRLDPIPQWVIPSRITFVSPQAQFTPKAVETAEERAKLMFRVKLRIDRALLERFEDRVKTGVRGTAYLRLPNAPEWPENLQVKLPE